jgi:hypothetical protein
LAAKANIRSSGASLMSIASLTGKLNTQCLHLRTSLSIATKKYPNIVSDFPINPPITPSMATRRNIPSEKTLSEAQGGPPTADQVSDTTPAVPA